ncbi:hypothetical protein RDWZM_007047 [Blomia tropicalis]|uniref:E3 ubiquitin-protein ligase ZNRF1 n=1 Tax=Blomia tropicalis TaxID=40697 RepID=A0A9Q0M8Q1_BLOTA|nr:E3 ubiquitin-protein ligase znrf2 [Blomia tropicalis]KAJ6221235.1 hypothetical protein RDWZM_007047 [Blomia tropicalis]
MGSKQSTTNSPSRVMQEDSSSSSGGNNGGSNGPYGPQYRNRNSDLTAITSNNSGTSSIRPSSDWRQRARSLTAVWAGDSHQPQSGSLDVLSPFGFKCPFCSKTILPDDVECHLVMCITKPTLNYNEDILSDDKEECVICLEEMVKGNTIARLPCLCIYHKNCIDAWFEVNRSCPEHPSD